MVEVYVSIPKHVWHILTIVPKNINANVNKDTVVKHVKRNYAQEVAVQNMVVNLDSVIMPLVSAIVVLISTVWNANICVAQAEVVQEVDVVAMEDATGKENANVMLVGSQVFVKIVIGKHVLFHAVATALV